MSGIINLSHNYPNQLLIFATLSLLYFNIAPGQCFASANSTRIEFGLHGSRVVYELVKFKLEATEDKNARIRRGTTNSWQTYTCSSTKCVNGVCKPRHYQGSNPPEWCRNLQPHRYGSNCQWSYQCWTRNGVRNCQQDRSSCERFYEDNSGQRSMSRSGSRSTFNFECHWYRCTVKQCQGSASCSYWGISRSDLTRQLKALPVCDDDDSKRRKRIAGTFGNLNGYCCEFEQRAPGVAVGTIRPRRRRSLGRRRGK